MIADSSSPTVAMQVRAISKGGADYRTYPTYIDQYAKFAEILRSIATPFVVIVPDDDITFPHAIDAALDYLLTHPEYVAAHGYVLRFRLDSHYFDIYDVDSYIPSIDEDNRLHRLSHLMQRYQPFMWAVFRTDAFAMALRRAAALKGTVFQELACMSISVLTGKVARLPIIYGMRGMEDSLTPPSDYDPFLWFLRDAESFFEKYLSYRNTVAKFIRSLDGGQLRRAWLGPMRRLRTLKLANGQKLVQVLDLINATLLGRTLDTDVLNHNVQLALGGSKKPINPPVGPTDPQPGDQVRSSSFEGRRYLWRHAVVEAKRWNEIDISAEEINIAERQLDAYVPDIVPTDSARMSKTDASPPSISPNDKLLLSTQPAPLLDRELKDQIEMIGYHPFILVRIPSQEIGVRFQICNTENDIASFSEQALALDVVRRSKLLLGVIHALQGKLFEGVELLCSWVAGVDLEPTETVYLGLPPGMDLPTYYYYPIYELGGASAPVGSQLRLEFLHRIYNSYTQAEGNNASRYQLVQLFTLSITRILALQRQFSQALNFLDEAITYVAEPDELKQARLSVELKAGGRVLPQRLRKYVGDAARTELISIHNLG